MSDISCVFLICSSYRAELTHTYLRRKLMLFNAIGYVDYVFTDY